MSLWKKAREMQETHSVLTSHAQDIITLLKRIDDNIVITHENDVEIGRRLRAIEKKLGLTASELEEVIVVKNEAERVK